MNLTRPLLHLSIGVTISALLMQFTNIKTNYLIIGGIILACICLLFIALSSSNNSVKSSPKRSKRTQTNERLVSGKVKWFNKTKGFGFITQTNGDDIFVHQSSITSFPKTLREGQSVTMNVVMDEKGPQAENVKVA